MSVSYYNGNEVPEMNYNITVDAELQEKSVTLRKNGTTVISPDSNYNALSSVTVNVDIEAKADPILQSKTIDITENGNTIVSPDSGYDGLSEVSVNVTVASSGGEDPSIISPEELIDLEKNRNNFFSSNYSYLRSTVVLTGDYVLDGLWTNWYYDTETQEYKAQLRLDGGEYSTPWYDSWALEKISSGGYNLMVSYMGKYYPLSDFLGIPILAEGGNSYISDNYNYYQDFDGNQKDCPYLYWYNHQLCFRDKWGEYRPTNPYNYMEYNLNFKASPGGYFILEDKGSTYSDKIGNFYSATIMNNFKGGIVPWHYGTGNPNLTEAVGSVTDGVLTINIGSGGAYYDSSTDYSSVKYLLLRKDGVYYNAEDVIWNLKNSNGNTIYYKGIGKIKEVDFEYSTTNMNNKFTGFVNLREIEKISNINPRTMSSCFSGCSSLTSIPELNTSNVTSMDNCFYNCSSLTSIPELNTSNVTNMERCFQACTSLKRIEGISFKSMSSISSSSSFIFGYSSNIPCRYLLIKDIGTNSACTTIDATYAKVWGIADDEVTDARQSLIDSLLTYSFDRATAGYSTCTIRLYSSVKAVLTEDEIAQIQAKGYTIS